MRAAGLRSRGVFLSHGCQLKDGHLDEQVVIMQVGLSLSVVVPD